MIALLTTVYASSKSDKPTNIYDFMPHFDEPEISLEEAMAKRFD